MNSYKTFLASRTIWGVVLMGVGAILSRWGFDLDPTVQADLIDKIVSFIPMATEAVGAFLAIYGRIKATKKIG